MNSSIALAMALPALATAGGAALVAVFRRPSEQLLAALLGLAAGIMLAATCFSLLVPALDAGSVSTVAAGFAVGGLMMAVLERLVPHLHGRIAEPHGPSEQMRKQHRALLLFIAISLHNIPEGAAVGTALADDWQNGLTVAVAIATQDIPEGFAISLPFIAAGMGWKTALGLGALSGLLEPLFALLAFGAFSLATGLLPAGLAFAGGAMLFVTVSELLPESMAGQNARTATLALMGGFLLMMTLDTALA